MVVLAQRDPLDDVTEMTQATIETLAPYSEDMSLDAKLHLLAVHGGQFLVADEFKPNCGRGVVPYPMTVAPMATVEAHMGANQRKRRLIILPLAFA